MVWRKQMKQKAIYLLSGAVVSLCSLAVAPAQTPAPCGTPDGAKPCAAPNAPSASQQFPFPGEESGDTGAPKSVSPSAGDSPTAPGAKPAKDQFPFPGESSTADPTDVPSPKSASGESSSSSTSDETQSDGDAKPGLKDEGTSGSTARGRRRLRPPAQKTLSDDERVEEDLSVAHFYQQTGNLNGAYMRVKDALKLQPQAPDAHLALAEVAQKLGKREEAVAEYIRYLELDPDGTGVKTAKKGLEKLQP